MEGWNSKDKLVGNEVYGDSASNSKAWAIQFDKIDFSKLKVESSDGSYSKEYTKEELVGKGDNEKMLGDQASIKKISGLNVYVKDNSLVKN